LPKQETVSFPTKQTYSDGKVVAWDQPTGENGAEPEHPAPSLTPITPPRGGRPPPPPPPDSPPAVIASTQIAAFDMQAQRLRRLTDDERDYLAQWRND
ncbi:DUF1775 domain-containing protein, partial [Nocardia brasiliensis]|uniref:DUF1775 domain-containing protein n=1 Tax=Nocardia brasiliensis TaxID=37326 RepID=UPI0024549372